jgi:hypothetical protein
MRNLSLAFSAAVFALVTAAAGGAFADIAPPDACTGAAGSTCSNAGPNADQAGVCTNEMCPHTGPGNGGAGGLSTTENPCVLCEPSTTTTTTTGAGGSSSTYSSSSGASTGGGCSVSLPGGDSVIAGTMLMIGLGVLLADRRRRRG